MQLSLKHIRQREDHTCGLCASRVVYQYYGLANKHLRNGLKVDKTLLAGTLPWDMLEQFRLDGFIVETLRPDSSAFRKIITRLNKGHPAVVLLGPVSKLHWVVFGGYDAKLKQFLVVDSCFYSNLGWNKINRDGATNDILLILSIRGNDEAKRECSKLDLLSEVKCIIPEFFKLDNILSKLKNLIP